MCGTFWLASGRFNTYMQSAQVFSKFLQFNLLQDKNLFRGKFMINFNETSFKKWNEKYISWKGWSVTYR